MINATANTMDDMKKTSVKSFADSAYSICFGSLFEFRLVHPKIKFSSTCFGEYKPLKLKKKCYFVVSCTLVRCFILVCTVA